MLALTTAQARLTSGVCTISMLDPFTSRLDELFQGLILDIRCGPFWDLIAGKVSTKLHGERSSGLASVVLMVL